MGDSQQTDGQRTLTEGQVAEELGLDRLELYLIMAAHNLGKHDSVTHLLVFSEVEVDQIAERLGRTRRKRPGPTEAELKRIPEPPGE